MAEGPPTLSQHFDQMLQRQAKMFSEILAKLDNLHRQSTRHEPPSGLSPPSSPDQAPPCSLAYPHTLPSSPLPPPSFPPSKSSSPTSILPSSQAQQTPSPATTSPQLSIPPFFNFHQTPHQPILNLQQNSHQNSNLRVSTPPGFIPISPATHIPQNNPNLTSSITPSTLTQSSPLTQSPPPQHQLSTIPLAQSSPSQNPHGFFQPQSPTPPPQYSLPPLLKTYSEMAATTTPTIENGFPWDRAKKQSICAEEYYNYDHLFGFNTAAKQRIEWSYDGEEFSWPIGYYEKEYNMDAGIWSLGDFAGSFNFVFKLHGESNLMLPTDPIEMPLEIGRINFMDLHIKFHLMHKAFKVFDKTFDKVVNDNEDFVLFGGAFIWRSLLAVENFEAFQGYENYDSTLFDLSPDAVVKMDITNWVGTLFVVQEWLKLPWPPPQRIHHKRVGMNFRLS